MTATMSCPNCGARLGITPVDGLCPTCLLRLALGAEPEIAAASVVHSPLPRAFGPYELVEEIGRGGMGVVYAARQPALGRTVAVKLLLSGAYGSDAALRRFRLEAAAAAGLQHPNIVAIHDYGEVDGQPYYAMDLVSGPNLGELCAGRPLLIRRAAEFMRLLAGAVHYAHQRGILHRDLKPSNVLVDEHDHPRIADFGLAKMLGSTEGATLTGQMLGSPSYASPEQAAVRGAEITAASDVYGLGALFYHLVTGRAPFNAATPTETLRLVLDTDPAPPRLLNPALPRDLETICLKCLAKDPARRYATAAEVAEDVERFLSDRPIRAQPPGTLYRMGKFARRHRTAVVAAAAVFLALAVGLGLALFGFRRAVVQRRAADAARGQAGQLIALISHELKPVVEQRGGLPQLIQMTEATVHYYETLPSELRNTKVDQGQADALAALGRLRGRSLNDFKGAEAALRAALALREKIARENPDDPEAGAAWLSDEYELPEVIGESTATISEARWKAMVSRGRELHRRFPGNLRVTQCLADVLSGYVGSIYQQLGNSRETDASFAERETLLEELLVSQPKDKIPSDRIGMILNALARASDAAGYIGHSAALSEQALAYCADALRADPGNVSLRELTAEAAINASHRCASWEKVGDAERIAREHNRVLVELSPNNQKYRLGYARAHSMEPWQLLNRAPDLEAPRKAFREFLALFEPILDRGGYYDQWQTLSVQEHLVLGVIAAWLGEPADAREEIERAQLRLSGYCSRLPEGAFGRCLARVNFLFMKGLVMYWLRDWPAMTEVARESQAEIRDGLKQNPAHGGLLLRQAEANAFLGIAAQREGRSAEAIEQLRPAIGIMRTTPRVYSVLDLHGFLGLAQRALIQSLVPHGDTEEARQVSEQLLQFEFEAPYVSELPAQESEAGALTLAASVCAPEEALRCLGLADRAKIMLTNPALAGRLTPDGKENLAMIARLRVAAAASLAPEALEKTGRLLSAAAASDPEASERITRAGESTWNLLMASSAISSPEAREANLAAREGYRALIARFPENDAYRFLLAESHRMECFVHLGWEGQIAPARAAFRQYDLLLGPFVGRKGYNSVLRTRLFNCLYLAQLAASVGDKADADGWLEEARKRFDGYRDSLPVGSAGGSLALIRFLEESAWTAWWLRDWSRLARLADEAHAECVDALKKQPSSEELFKRRAMADSFAALALAGAGQNVAAAPQLQAARDALKATQENPSLAGACDGGTVVWAIESAWVDALRKNGELTKARKRMDELRYANEWWAPSFPEYWRAQKHLATVRILAASFLDPNVPFEEARRKELLDETDAMLAPDKVAGRLTVDVQESLQEIERLRAAIVTPSR
jgi:tetratricopeptide (TPR) repeat protein